MPLDRGSRFREDYDKIENIRSPFKEEIIIVNEELKKLNFERDRFDKQLFGGIKGLLNRDRFKVFKKKDLSSKYKLTNFLEQIKKEEFLYNKFNMYSFKKNIDLIDIAELNDLYDILEDRLFATTFLIEMIAKYKASNFKLNDLYEKHNSSGPFLFEIYLFSGSENLFTYIKNPEIKQIGKKMYDEYIEKKEEEEKINEKITKLESDIKAKMSIQSKKKLSLEQLRQYKDMLQGANELLSRQSDELISNNHKNI